MDPCVALVHPPLDAVPSGGNIYDAKLLACARHAGSPWTSLVWPAAASELRAHDVVIWDSLLLGQVQRMGAEHVGLLLHYLPSLQCAGPAAARASAQEDAAAAHADFVIATGKALAEVARERWPRLPVCVCEPGVAPFFRRRQRPGTQPEIALLTVANLLPNKGHRGLLEVLARLSTVRWQWHLAGKDDARFGIEAALRARAGQAGIAERLVFHGPVPQRRVAALMARADLLLHASAAESYGMVLAEAAACALPAVSFRVGAAAELIADGESGLLAPPGDWSLFGSHVERVLTHPALRAAFARRLAAAPVRRWERTFAAVQAAIAAMIS